MDFSEVQVWLTDTEDYVGNGVAAKVKPDGTLAFENLPEGDYQLGIGGRPPGFSPDFYLKDALVTRACWTADWRFRPLMANARWKF